MIFERYSGSDASGEVPRGYARFLLRSAELSLEERCSFFDEVLAVEEDRNWRGYWLYHRATQFLGSEQVEQLITDLTSALAQFDLLAHNFPDVENEYARTLWLLVRDCYLSSPSDPDVLLEYALRLLPHIEAVSPDRDDRWELYSNVGDALLMVAGREENALLYRVAIDYHSAAHHARPEEPGALESLVYAYFGAGNVASARAVFEMYNELNMPYEHAERLHTFAARAFQG